MNNNYITLITGSTRGIGKQIGIDLLKKGHKVIFIGHSHKSIIKLRKELMKKKLKRYEIIKYNLGNILDIYSLTEYIKRNYKYLNNIICNIAITDRTKFGEITLENWNTVLNTNLTYPFFMIQDLKNIIQEKGKIIFMGALAGHIPDATSIVYGTSKGAIEILTKYLSKEFAGKKITVNTIAPGYTLTEWHKKKSKAQMKRIANKTLLKRFATVKEISKTCLLILENDYINAQIISVDGGFGLC